LPASLQREEKLGRAQEMKRGLPARKALKREQGQAENHREKKSNLPSKGELTWNKEPHWEVLS